MKTRFYVGLIALAALAFVGCAKDEVKSSVDNAIEFGTCLGRDAQTKGSVFDTETMQGENVGFGVFAYYTNDAQYSGAATPNFMNNQQVTYNESAKAWTYAPVKYWPNEATDYVSFFAYAPYDEYTVPGSGDPIIDFTVPADVTSHIDLVAAENSHIDCQKQAINGKILFTFKHALSRVGFKVEAVMDEVNDQVNGATPDTDNQDNPITAGTTISVQEVEIYSYFNNSGKLNLNGAEWTDRAFSYTSYKLTRDNFEAVADEVTITPTPLNNEESYMMLIPTAASNKVKVRVKYTVTTEDNKLTGGASVVENNITSDEFDFQFEQGKAYTFVLHLGLTSVKLDAEVAVWDEMGDYVVNVPNNFEK